MKKNTKKSKPATRKAKPGKAHMPKSGSARPHPKSAAHLPKKVTATPVTPMPVPRHECPVCGSRNVHYNKERAELICRECGEIHAQIV
ncbi:MAG: hypothetical protein QS98_C0008G0002 [archaeon GW2011_AR3]|nr:MAG: hypothetical protein QS98_C0008G0002 [archaeon GW2011_AR3]